MKCSAAQGSVVCGSAAWHMEVDVAWHKVDVTWCKEDVVQHKEVWCGTTRCGMAQRGCHMAQRSAVWYKEVWHGMRKCGMAQGSAVQHKEVSSIRRISY
jgi:hypothetical protein